jgi:hypothetical protein
VELLFFPITRSIYYFILYRRIRPYDRSRASAGVFHALRCVLSTSAHVQHVSRRELLPSHTKAYHKAHEGVGIFFAMYTRCIHVYIKLEAISSTPTFLNMTESHIGPATFGDKLDRSMTVLGNHWLKIF